MSKEGTKKTKKIIKKKVVKSKKNPLSKTTKKVVKKKKITPTEKKTEILKQVQNDNDSIKINKNKPVENLGNKSFDYSKYESKNSANIWLWSGITIIIIFMVTIWFMSLKLQINNYDKLQGSDSNLIQKTQEHWDDSFIKTKEQENQKQNLKKQIENILKEFNDAVIETASTTVSTSTEQTTTSTLEFTTSTKILTDQTTSTNS